MDKTVLELADWFRSLSPQKRQYAQTLIKALASRMGQFDAWQLAYKLMTEVVLGEPPK